MVSMFYDHHPKEEEAIKAVVLIVSRGDQPPQGMDTSAAVENDYVEWDSAWIDGDHVPRLYLTKKGERAAGRWRKQSRQTAK